MTFASMTLNENPAAVNVAKDNNNNPISVKVSFGADIRRVTFNGTSFAPLRDLVAGLFVLDPASIQVKYQDEDEDKITMSTDGELQEALRLSKGTLRLFVENKANPAPQEAAKDPAAPAEMPFWGHGPFRGRHGFHHGHHGPHGPHGPHGHGPFGRGGFGGFGRGGFGGFGHHGFGHHAGFGGPAPAGPCASPAGPFPHAYPPSSPVVAHGEFSPAPTKDGGEYAEMFRDRKLFKARKMEFKQTIAAMKASAVTEDDRKAIKKFKEEMKDELKAFKKQFEKGDKHKHHKHDRCDKTERLMARHVADVTIPDNSELPPDTAVVKTWKIRNAGTIAWPPGCQLLFISHAGDQLSGPERVVIEEPVFPQQEVDVSVPLLTPGEPGRYVGYYRMATPAGVKFGQRVWVSFVIPNGPANATTATAPAAMVH